MLPFSVHANLIKCRPRLAGLINGYSSQQQKTSPTIAEFDHVRLFPHRSPRRSSANAAEGGLKPPPEERLREADNLSSSVQHRFQPPITSDDLQRSWRTSLNSGVYRFPFPSLVPVPFQENPIGSPVRERWGTSDRWAMTVCADGPRGLRKKLAEQAGLCSHQSDEC